MHSSCCSAASLFRLSDFIPDSRVIFLNPGNSIQGRRTCCSFFLSFFETCLHFVTLYYEWPRQDFSLQYQHNVNQISDESKHKKPTLCYGHYVKDKLHHRHHIIDINLLYYGHYDCMTLIIVILFGEINATCIPILFKFITPKFLVLWT